MNTIEKAIAQMEAWAADDSHGYDQSARWGPDYDCSSAVISAWELAGVPVKSSGATYTGNMRGVFLRCGFEDVTGSVDLGSGACLRRGDVLLNHQHHTAVYCGGGMEVEASINEHGGVTGGQTGDQTGAEFKLRPYRNYPWDCVLRYTGAESPKQPTKDKPTYFYTVKLPLLKQGMSDIAVRAVQMLLTALDYYHGEADGEYGELTKRAVMGYQADMGLDPDGEVGGNTWNVLIKGYRQMDEEKKKLDDAAAAGGDTGSAGDTGAAGDAAPAPNQPNRIDEINKLYDAQKQNQLDQLENAYNQSLSDAQAAAGKIPGTYQTQANDLAVQYERNRRNLNQQAAGNGINTGTGSQQALALQSQWQRDYGGIKQAQADAQAEADRGMVDLTTRYQNSISQAVSENDYKRAAALLDEYNNQYKNDMNKAQILAQFGDFSGFAGLYGQEQADKMFNIWKVQNPDLAWNTGNLTAAEYEAMTGKPPINSPGGGGTIADVINGMMNGGGSGGGGGESGGFSDYVANYMWGDAHKNNGGGSNSGGTSKNPYSEYLANIYYGTPGTTNPHK